MNHVQAVEDLIAEIEFPKKNIIDEAWEAGFTAGYEAGSAAAPHPSCHRCEKIVSVGLAYDGGWEDGYHAAIEAVMTHQPLPGLQAVRKAVQAIVDNAPLIAVADDSDEQEREAIFMAALNLLESLARVEGAPRMSAAQRQEMVAEFKAKIV